MKKFFTNKSVINKIIIMLTLVILFNFAVPVKSNAGFLATVGGEIGEALMNFTVFIGDTVLSFAEYCFTGKWNFIITGAGLRKVSGSTSWQDKTNIDQPDIRLSPEAIFQNKVALLNPNFIQPTSDTMAQSDSYLQSSTTEGSIISLREIIARWYVALRTLALVGLLSVLVYTGIRIIISSTAQDKAKYKERLLDWVVAFCLLFCLHYIMLFTFKITDSITSIFTSSSSTGISLKNNDKLEVGDKVGLEAMNTMLSGSGFWFEWDRNTVSQDAVYVGFSRSAAIEWPGDGLGFLKPPELPNNIKGWAKDYQWQRMWGTAEGKTYGNVALDVLGGDTHFFAELYTLEDGTVVQLFDTTDGDVKVAIDEETNMFEEWEWINFYKDGSYNQYKFKLDDNAGWEFGDPIDDLTLEYFKKQHTDSNGNTGEWEDISKEGEEFKPKNLLEYARIYCESSRKIGGEFYAYVIIYIVLVIYTIMFILRYMKRLIYLAFLTLMAPLVALTYPIDKMKDGKAQAFNMWLKEFIFNVLIQPFHLLIYIVLVGSALELASTNMIYAVVAIGFLIPAENILRKLFGFDSASTLSKAGSFGAGALTASLFGALKKKPKLPGLGGKGKGKGEDSYSAGENDDKINYYNNNEGSALDELGMGGRNQNNNNNNLGASNPGNSPALLGPSAESGESPESNPLEGRARVLSEGPAQALSDEEINPNWARSADGNGYVDMDPRRRLSDEEAARHRQTANRYTGSKTKRNKAWAAAKAGYKGLFGKGKVGRRVIKGAAKVSAGTLLAGAGAIFGIAAGIASSGDPSKALQYGALGLSAGAYAGSNVVDATTGLVSGGYNVIKNTPSNIKNGYNNIKNDIRNDYHQQVDSPEEYANYQENIRMEQKEKEIKKFKKNDKHLKQEFGNAEAERIMDTALPTYFDNNITDSKEIAAVENLRKDIGSNNTQISEEQARAQAIQEFRVNRELKSRGLSKHKDKVEEIRARLKKAGMEEGLAGDQAERIVQHGNMMNDYISRNSK